MINSLEKLFQCPCWIIDILPEQVPADSPGQYFAIEKYYLESGRLAEVKQKHINVVLKLNCYRSISLDEGKTYDPSPEYVAGEMRKRYLCIMIDGAVIVSEPDDTHMTIFNPDEKLLDLVKAVSAGEGLFVWKPVNL